MGRLKEASDDYAKLVEHDPSPENRVTYSHSLFACEIYDAAMSGGHDFTL